MGHWFVSFRPSLRSGRAVKEQRLRRLWLSLFDGGRGNISAQSKSVDIDFVHALSFFIAAPFLGAEVCCAIYSFVAASLLRLDREALPLVLSASLSRKA